MNLTSFLLNTTPVTIVGNDKLEGKPLVTALMNADGTPKTDLNGNALGSIRLEQHQRTLSGTFLNARRRVAFIGGTYDELMKIVKENNIKEGSTLPGHIIIRESLSPIFKGQNPKVNPQSGEMVQVTVGNNKYPVYMQMSYTENSNDKDFLIRSAADALPILMSQNISAATSTENVIETANVPATEEVE